MDTKEYLLIDKQIRQAHLDLSQPCIERGGASTQHKGVLAQYLDGQIHCKPASLCHACNNPKCSNPRHLYWGSAKENTLDAVVLGTVRSPFQRLVEKFGYDEACRRNSRSSEVAARGGKGNAGKPKATEHKEKISKAHFARSARARGEAG